MLLPSDPGGCTCYVPNLTDRWMFYDRLFTTDQTLTDQTEYTIVLIHNGATGDNFAGSGVEASTKIRLRGYQRVHFLRETGSIAERLLRAIPSRRAALPWLATPDKPGNGGLQRSPRESKGDRAVMLVETESRHARGVAPLSGVRSVGVPAGWPGSGGASPLTGANFPRPQERVRAARSEPCAGCSPEAGFSGSWILQPRFDRFGTGWPLDERPAWRVG